jgi:hypothetical protein
MALILIIAQMFILSAINRKRDQDYGDPEDYTSAMKREEMDLGDEASFFRYAI